MKYNAIYENTMSIGLEVQQPVSKVTNYYEKKVKLVEVRQASDSLTEKGSLGDAAGDLKSATHPAEAIGLSSHTSET